jgi:hypothetical protein
MPVVLVERGFRIFRTSIMKTGVVDGSILLLTNGPVTIRVLGVEGSMLQEDGNAKY